MNTTQFTAAVIFSISALSSNAFAGSGDNFVKEVLQGQHQPVQAIASSQRDVNQSLATFLQLWTNNHPRVTPETHAKNLSANGHEFTKQYGG